MSLFVESEVRARAQSEIRKSFNLKSAVQLVVESTSDFSSSKTYDVFLSHSIKDAELILGIKGLLEDLGYDVYVDWIDDPQLDRTRVSKSTAQKLRDRMDASKSLFFVTTDNTDSSKWMPWECGYFDGIKEKVAIVPIKQYSSNNEYVGQEYLGLYPYLVKQKSTEGKEMLWIHADKKRYTSYNSWVKTPNAAIVWKEE
jgi:hypothetical protein